jgi:hypothetical protein
VRENPWRGRGTAAIEAAALAQFPGGKNAGMSTKGELRIGHKGSISVRLTGPKAGAWYDHERGVGGYLKGDQAGDGRVEDRRPSRGKARSRQLIGGGDEAGGASAGPAITKDSDQLLHSSASAGRVDGHDAPGEGAAAGDAGEAAERAAQEQAVRERLLHLQGQFDAAEPLQGTPGEEYLILHRKLAGPFPSSLRYARTFRPRPEAAARPALLAAVTDAGGGLVALHAVQIDPGRATRPGSTRPSARTARSARARSSSGARPSPRPRWWSRRGSRPRSRGGSSGRPTSTPAPAG